MCPQSVPRMAAPENMVQGKKLGGERELESLALSGSLHTRWGCNEMASKPR